MQAWGRRARRGKANKRKISYATSLCSARRSLSTLAHIKKICVRSKKNTNKSRVSEWRMSPSPVRDRWIHANQRSDYDNAHSCLIWRQLQSWGEKFFSLDVWRTTTEWFTFLACSRLSGRGRIFLPIFRRSWCKTADIFHIKGSFPTRKL